VVSTCPSVVDGATCTGGTALRVIQASGNVLAHAGPDPGCGGCATMRSLSNPTKTPVRYALRLLCDNGTSDYEAGSAACSGIVRQSVQPLVKTGCPPFALYPGLDTSECRIKVPKDTAVQGVLACTSGTPASVSVLSDTGAVLSTSGCGHFDSPLFGADTALRLRVSCGNQTCTGHTRYSFSVLHAACPAFALSSDQKYASCAVTVPAYTGLTLRSSCDSGCDGTTGVALVEPSGNTLQQAVGCVTAPCVYGSYNNTRGTPVVLLLRQGCVPLAESRCAGRTKIDYVN